MMRVRVKDGQRAAAILQYETRQILQDELGIEPSSITTLLYEHIKADDFASDRDLAASIRTFTPMWWGNLPTVNALYGRLFATATDGSIKLWDVQSRELYKELYGDVSFV